MTTYGREITRARLTEALHHLGIRVDNTTEVTIKPMAITISRVRFDYKSPKNDLGNHRLVTITEHISIKDGR